MSREFKCATDAEIYVTVALAREEYVMILRLSVFACLAATAASFKPLHIASKPLSRGERPAHPQLAPGSGTILRARTGMWPACPFPKFGPESWE